MYYSNTTFRFNPKAMMHPNPPEALLHKSRQQQVGLAAGLKFRLLQHSSLTSCDAAGLRLVPLPLNSGRLAEQLTDGSKCVIHVYEEDAMVCAYSPQVQSFHLNVQWQACQRARCITTSDCLHPTDLRLELSQTTSDLAQQTVGKWDDEDMQQLLLPRCSRSKS